MSNQTLEMLLTVDQIQDELAIHIDNVFNRYQQTTKCKAVHHTWRIQNDHIVFYCDPDATGVDFISIPFRYFCDTENSFKQLEKETATLSQDFHTLAELQEKHDDHVETIFAKYNQLTGHRHENILSWTAYSTCITFYCDMEDNGPFMINIPIKFFTHPDKAFAQLAQDQQEEKRIAAKPLWSPEQHKAKKLKHTETGRS